MVRARDPAAPRWCRPAPHFRYAGPPADNVVLSLAGCIGPTNGRITRDPGNPAGDALYRRLAALTGLTPAR